MDATKQDKHVCQEPTCTMPAMYPYAVCPRHLLWGERCIVPGCPHVRLFRDVTCWFHKLDDARLDTQPITVEDSARAPR